MLIQIKKSVNGEWINILCYICENNTTLMEQRLKDKGPPQQHAAKKI